MIFTDTITTVLGGTKFERTTTEQGSTSYTVNNVGVGKVDFEEQVMAAYERERRSNKRRAFSRSKRAKTKVL